MLKDADRIFTNIDGNNAAELSSAIDRGDWNKTGEFISKGRDWILKEIVNSRLRGRGGAGFYTGVKLGFIPMNRPPGQSAYLIVNADESEPGTCKDRAIITNEPHKIIEGALITAFVIGATAVYIYIRGEFYREAQLLQNAIDEARNAGLLSRDANNGYSCEIHVHRGAGAYICGEETALLESLSGRPGKPRNKPPFPALVGYCGCPTVINNVETIAVIPTILRRTAKWFASIGTEGSRGTKLFCMSGHINNPCVVEEVMGISMRDLIEQYGHGVQGGWDNLLAVWPGGSSCYMLPKRICENAIMGFSELQAVGSALGTGGMIVVNQSADIVEATERLTHFYMHESCGQCTPCREGTGWMWRTIKKIRMGLASCNEVDLLYDISKKIEGNTICALADASTWAIQGLLMHFKDELLKRCCEKIS